MADAPTISVVMPCYNAGMAVRSAVESIQAQTWKEWELIVIDDGSTDQSADIVESIAQNDQRVRLLRRPHRGVVAPSNEAMTQARGHFIARMDADDVSRPDRLRCQLKALIDNNHWGAVSCKTHFAGDPDKARGYAHHVHWANQAISTSEIELSRFVDLPVPHPTLMFRSELLDLHGDYRNGNFPEDYELVLRWISQGVIIGKVDQCLFDWYDPPSRLSRNDNRYDSLAFHRCKAPFLLDAIEKSGCANRDLWIVGAGRPARVNARPLELLWKKASGFIDADPRKIGRIIHDSPVVSIDDLPERDDAVIVSYVGTRGSRKAIQEQLLRQGRREGLDFWLAT